MKDREIIEPIISQYFNSFLRKEFNGENNDHDILMDLFGISPDLKREHSQYWGRELGMLWQLIVDGLAKTHCKDYEPALIIGNDQLCDLRIGNDAIDTKYRVGSGDSGKHKELKRYGKILREKRYRPVLLFVREDNLPAAITAANTGGWTIYTGKETFKYIKAKIGVDIEELIHSFRDKYHIANNDLPI